MFMIDMFMIDMFMIDMNVNIDTHVCTYRYTDVHSIYLYTYEILTHSKIMVTSHFLSACFSVGPRPLVCEDKNVPYVFVKSKTALGRACGVSRRMRSGSRYTYGFLELSRI